ncbi:hypothetical protein [Rickettsia endosymbiont of Orchestes rusci]|uniref:hypothetical protein n=1 Tax=Rickettsia endosymbiont of Orchestes rusci TaxID=3066250 RepID=UPI00313DC2CA
MQSVSVSYRGLTGVVAWIRNCRKKGVIPAKAGIHSCHAELVSASITQGIVAWLEN